MLQESLAHMIQQSNLDMMTSCSTKAAEFENMTAEIENDATAEHTIGEGL